MVEPCLALTRITRSVATNTTTSAPCDEHQVRQFSGQCHSQVPERISYLLYTSFPVSTNNDVEGLKFENAKPVYFPPSRIADGPSPVNSEVLQAGMARCSTISTGRSPASPIPISLSTTGSRTMTKACQIKPDWNAAVCKGDFGRLRIGGGGRRSWRRR